MVRARYSNLNGVIISDEEDTPNMYLESEVSFLLNNKEDNEQVVSLFANNEPEKEEYFSLTSDGDICINLLDLDDIYLKSDTAFSLDVLTNKFAFLVSIAEQIMGDKLTKQEYTAFKEIVDKLYTEKDEPVLADLIGLLLCVPELERVHLAFEIIDDYKCFNGKTSKKLKSNDDITICISSLSHLIKDVARLIIFDFVDRITKRNNENNVKTKVVVLDNKIFKSDSYFEIFKDFVSKSNNQERVVSFGMPGCSSALLNARNTKFIVDIDFVFVAGYNKSKSKALITKAFLIDEENSEDVNLYLVNE